MPSSAGLSRVGSGRGIEPTSPCSGHFRNSLVLRLEPRVGAMRDGGIPQQEQTQMPAREWGCDESQPGKPCVCPGGSHGLSVAGGARESSCRGPAARVRLAPGTLHPLSLGAQTHVGGLKAGGSPAPGAKEQRLQMATSPQTNRQGARTSDRTREPVRTCRQADTLSCPGTKAAAADAVTMTRPARQGPGVDPQGQHCGSVSRPWPAGLSLCPFQRAGQELGPTPRHPAGPASSACARCAGKGAP